jgi:hypothetical protein
MVSRSAALRSLHDDEPNSSKQQQEKSSKHKQQAAASRRLTTAAAAAAHLRSALEHQCAVDQRQRAVHQVQCCTLLQG